MTQNNLLTNNVQAIFGYPVMLSMALPFTNDGGKTVHAIKRKVNGRMVIFASQEYINDLRKNVHER